MYFICLNDLRFPKNKTELYFPVKKKHEWANSATGKKRRWRKKRRKEAYFSYMGKILKQIHPDFSGRSWVLYALGALNAWQLEWVSLEAFRLSFYNHRRAITGREILGAVKQRSSQKSF
ncbi:histone H2B.N [Homo sapiens]|uniref:Histone H2B.N n=1 Tax=Homo sapiens TaxID=9606 RepID=H2BN1_HUMAN|nr:histone H2A.N [Homo sapiens]P0DW85.1 RecName: Full=Histone H2A.N; Short=H2B.N; AltName: Full=H2B.N variant histone 1 [Homo sapiens]